MSERDVKRVEVLNEVQSGRRTVASVATVLKLSDRHVRYRDRGSGALSHQARG